MSQKAVETKQLSPRLAGEWFGIPLLLSTGVYTELGTGRSAVSAVLGEGGQKSIVWSCKLYSSVALELQHVSLCIIITVYTGF